MKAGRPKLFWRIFVLVIAIVVVATVLLLLPSDNRGAKLVAETRQTLRREGFKTDLADFDFSTSPELRQREAALQALAGTPTGLGGIAPNLMETVDNNSAVVVWKGDSFMSQMPRWPSPGEQMSWDEFRQQLNEHKPTIDAACEAILSGPIRFNLIASNGSAMRLPHLALLRGLAEALCYRTVLELHDGSMDAAWTNLLAATRLVTASEPEPIEISHLIRFMEAKEVFNTTWQALQADGWSDAQLARLQQEWDGVDFFTNLSEIAAFKRASDADNAVRTRDMMLKSRSFLQFAMQLVRAPNNISASIRERSIESDYLHHGWYEDQKDLMLYNRDLEVNLRNAVRSPTWAQMRQLPDVTNQVPFQSKFRLSRMQVFFNIRQTAALVLQRRGGGLLERAAEAEADRRILLTALAIERYRAKHGTYPSTLASLAPDFLKTVPVDFMDGQPLRYRLRDDGRFLLYSVGLDCVDDGGQMAPEAGPGQANFRPANFNGFPTGDIVWPFPASTAAVDARRQQQIALLRSREDEAAGVEAERQWELTARHQASAEKLLAAPKANPPDPDFHGHPLSQVLCNTNSAGTNRLTLGQMLTLKQIVTGQEPETVTFELPVNYDVLTNIGELMLFIDMNNDDSDEPSDVQQFECDRATNGDCLLVWSTIYESPGKHALQAGIFLNEQQQAIRFSATTGAPEPNTVTTGPPTLFTVTNLCQFSIGSAHFDPQIGAIFCARLPEDNGKYVAQLTTTNGTLLKTFTGSTTNGVFNFLWDLTDDHGQRLTDNYFNSVFHITLPDSGRSQTLRGP